MKLIIFGFVGIIVLVSGVYFLTGKKVFYSRKLDAALFLSYIIIFTVADFSSPIPDPRDDYGGGIIFIIVAILLLFVFFVFINLGKYSVINAKKASVMSIVMGILDEKNIDYQLEDSTIRFTKYDNEITFRDMGNLVDINLRGIRSNPIYKDLIQGLKLQSKLIQEKVFPVLGVVLSIGGAIMIFLAFIVCFKG